jgi:hypothetical protein
MNPSELFLVCTAGHYTSGNLTAHRRLIFKIEPPIHLGVESNPRNLERYVSHYSSIVVDAIFDVYDRT